MLSEKDESIKELFFTIRQIVLNAHPQLEEGIKWGMPHYDHKGIMCGIGAFKNHVSLWFHKGDLMSNNLELFNTDSSAKTMGQIKMSNLDEINSEGIAAYIKEAIAINELSPKKTKSVKKPVPKTKKELIISESFQSALSENLVAKELFESMTTSQKNGYLDYVEESKTEVTKQKRIARSIERIAKGLKTIY
jgi:uncharacterized protein YdeI (YjbR/CyaY-like superfamily)